MSESTISADRAISFGPFRLLPAQQLLLEDEAPVRLGSRALEILMALVERAGELVSKTELTARVWPSTFVDENTLRVHIAGLRRALGDGQPGRRYLANVPGRGYRFVAPVSLSEPERPQVQRIAVAAQTHNLPVSQSRAVGRAEVIGALLDQLPKRRFITIVGAGGIGKTTVALAMAEALLPAYEDGIRFVDLAPVNDPKFVPNTLGATLGLTVHSEDAIPLLIDYLRDKRILVILDNCEHVVDIATALAERLLAEVPGLHILATSREPLRAEGERVHRLSALECPAVSPDLTAAEALSFPAVQLFVERAAAILDGFELSDADAPIVADICRKLGGVALAIELAAARVDAFGIRQLSVLLDDRFRILKQGKRTAQPRHQSLTAALDWSYEFLPEVECVVLRRLSVFVGAFTLESAIAVAGDDNTDVVEGVANLVAKSLISADVSGPIVQYRLLDTTRAYALQKLIQNGEFDDCARCHALHYLNLFTRAEAEFSTKSSVDWLSSYGHRIDDVRCALNWAFSATGDKATGVELTVAAIPLWTSLSLMDESRERIECALAVQTVESGRGGRAELKLLMSLAAAVPNTKHPFPNYDILWMNGLTLAEELGDSEYQGRAIWGLCVYLLYLGHYGEVARLSEKYNSIDFKSRIIGERLAGTASFFTGNYSNAEHHFDRMLGYYDEDLAVHRALVAPFPPDERLAAYTIISNILWIKGFPDQAVAKIHDALDEAHALEHPILLCLALALNTCPLLLQVGDLVAAEAPVDMLLELSAKHGLGAWNALGRCLQGMLLMARGDPSGLLLLQSSLDWLFKAKFALNYAAFLGVLAEGLAIAGRMSEASKAIDEALELSQSNAEHWCLPELLRIKGEVLRLDQSVHEAGATEGYFLQALDWARRQEALSWELRAATSLAKLLHHNDKTAEADKLLSAVYDRFTEGFDTADLKTARALIDELRPAPAG